MNFETLALMFNRSLIFTFSKMKLLLVFSVLALCGLLLVFFQGLGQSSGQWVFLSLTFLPLFLCTGVFLALGIFLIRVYYREVKNKEIDYKDILGHSWETILSASYVSIPIVICFIFLWMLLGIFILLSNLPSIGQFFNLVLVFAPFLIHLATLVLCLLSVGILFFASPLIALKGLDRHSMYQEFKQRLTFDPFINGLLLFIALLPLVLVLSLLVLSSILTEALCSNCLTPIHTILKSFFIMLPFVAFLTPAVIFFFNFSAESFVFIQKQSRAG